jgi:hypothetical protein
MRKKIVLLTLTLAVLAGTAVLVRTAEFSTITLSGLRQITVEDQNAIPTAYIVLLKEETNNEFAKLAESNFMDYNMAAARRYVRTEQEIFIDSRTNTLKRVITDLRDINALIAEHNIQDTPLNRHNLDISMTILRQGDNYFSYHPDSAAGFFREEPAKTISAQDYTSLGIIPEKILEQDIRLSNIEADGKALSKVEWSRENPEGIVTGEIICDPAIGYRFRSIRWSEQGRVTKEIIADDYRDVDGIPYPFLYVTRNFNKETGEVVREERFTIEQAEFGFEMDDNDLKVFIPKGTNITTTMPLSPTESMALNSRVHLGKEMGMEDLITLRDDAEELYLAQHQETQE